MKNIRLIFVFVLTILATVIFPVMSQGLHGSCQGTFVKIAKFDENNKTILTSCVTSNVVERFIELGWHITPVNSSRLHLVPNEGITMVAKEVIEDTEVVTE